MDLRHRPVKEIMRREVVTLAARETLDLTQDIRTAAASATCQCSTTDACGDRPVATCSRRAPEGMASSTRAVGFLARSRSAT